ncbi:MAG: Arc family DNA-binding protein [Bacteroidales bacterium]|nr:Arc family DNA-binding protein [Bacteroidales bacterium]
MEAQARIQTVLRLPTELYQRVKRNANKEHRSFNSYIEHVLDKETDIIFPKLGPDFKISDEIQRLSGTVHLRKLSKEELDADPKLAYLAEKYGL